MVPRGSEENLRKRSTYGHDREQQPHERRPLSTSAPAVRVRPAMDDLAYMAHASDLGAALDMASMGARAAIDPSVLSNDVYLSRVDEEELTASWRWMLRRR